MTKELVNLGIFNTLQELDRVINIPLDDELDSYLMGVKDTLDIIFDRIEVKEAKDAIIEAVKNTCPKYFAIKEINKLGQQLNNTSKNHVEVRKMLAQCIKQWAQYAEVSRIDADYSAGGYIALADIVLNDYDSNL